MSFSLLSNNCPRRFSTLIKLPQKVTEDDFESLSSFTIYDLISGTSGTYFRCNYGACIPQFYTCNGLIDCFDSSDETRGIICPRNNFRCNYGGCISRNKRCNGINDCIDGSDETSKLCQRNRCRLKYFQCDYGACIFGRKKCNGKRDCADGSDETAATCGANHVLKKFFVSLSSVENVAIEIYHAEKK
ncbi:Very low-density lipoprotein receptor [Armadillidium vulgare]|nr:Very low-density lipoprotein receptor [Armadillidium vulgare]